MEPIEGRLQTAEHILAKILEQKIDDIKIGIAKFDDSGILEIYSEFDPRVLDKIELEKQVNSIISKSLIVKKYMVDRDKTDINSDKVPSDIKQIRIVEICGFDKRPCKDPHVDNTNQIGLFVLDKIKRAGKDRYRFVFHVE